VALMRIDDPAPRSPAPAGFALFALGFRPLYLLAAAFAALAVPLWALQFAGVLSGPGLLWHAHEMLFGYAFGIIAGFLLTAVRAWTARDTPTGAPLAVIAGLWLAARIAGYASPLAGVILDALFAVAVACGIGGPLVRSGNRRNWFFIPLVLALGAASVAFLRLPATGLAVALDLVLFIMAVMGGRVIPAFTNNAVAGANARRNAWLERSALGSVLLLLVCDAFQLHIASGAVALVAAVLHAARLALWSPWSTRTRPILWILHASYAWIAVHLALRGLDLFVAVAPGLATHALTVGAIGGLTLGMITRTARGHTGRPLQVGSVEVLAYVLVQLAAIVRVLLPIVFPGAYAALIGLSAALWCAAFALYVWVYAPFLARPRLDGKPG
jgi:uncharacterized protein involved in response to NO